MALLAHPNVADEPMAYFGLARLPASPAQTLNLGELWMREPFAPFECDEEDWLFFTRLVEGAVVRSAIGGLFGGAP